MSAQSESGNSGDDENKRVSKVGIIAAGIGAIGVIGAAAVGGILASSSPSTSVPPPSSNSASPPTPTTNVCSPFRVNVHIPDQVGPNAVLTIDFLCAPAAGQQYLRITEAKNIGSNRHSEFYPKPFESGVQVGAPFNRTIDFSKDSIGEENCFYVVSVPDAEEDEILNNLEPGGFAYSLPADANIVSAQACETRVR